MILMIQLMVLISTMIQLMQKWSRLLGHTAYYLLIFPIFPLAWSGHLERLERIFTAFIREFRGLRFQQIFSRSKIMLNVRSEISFIEYLYDVTDFPNL